ncbi:hypothetical protein IGS67_03785 [Flavimobilis sp. GY10621]|uniref:Uncharacterized protein n=1 Tax=Flavimobilis rhizosphaerae TaxID=2775421 RepID=A0ABR9DNC0_9MICO|nr:hypothetical protein [Flavimobilis rhizosphaerae]MBD9698616.1 hypothetical protein [Flavimobilis rhizosphaerae]
MSSSAAVPAYVLPLPPEGEAWLRVADVLAASWLVLVPLALLAAALCVRRRVDRIALASVWVGSLVVVALLVTVTLRAWLVPTLWPASYFNDVGGAGQPTTFRPTLGSALGEVAAPLVAAVLAVVVGVVTERWGRHRSARVRGVDVRTAA